MAPSAWVKGGAGVTIRWAVVESSLGPMLVAATDKGVCRLSFGRGREELERLFPNADLVQGGADFEALLQRVVAAVDDPASGRDIPVDVRGTAFQERVWQELYPRTLEIRRVTGEGLVSFVIDENGRVLPETIVLLSASRDEFGEAVLRGVPRLRFRPMRVGGTPVRSSLAKSASE